MQPHKCLLPCLSADGTPRLPAVEVHAFEDDDPFQTQIDRLLAGTPSCTYEQALQTYELTWAIREAGERERLEEQDE